MWSHTHMCWYSVESPKLSMEFLGYLTTTIHLNETDYSYTVICKITTTRFAFTPLLNSLRPSEAYMCRQCSGSPLVHVAPSLYLNQCWQCLLIGPERQTSEKSQSNYSSTIKSDTWHVDHYIHNLVYKEEMHSVHDDVMTRNRFPRLWPNCVRFQKKLQW